jgi:hypothetical protein
LTSRLAFDPKWYNIFSIAPAIALFFKEFFRLTLDGFFLRKTAMNDIPLIALCVSSVLSVAAIVISVLSFRSSRRAQHHTQIVSFEQRRQEVRQILFEGQLMIGEINAEMNRALRTLKRSPHPTFPFSSAIRFPAWTLSPASSAKP